MKKILMAVGLFGGVVLVWLLYAWIRVELAADTHDEWSRIAARLGLNLRDSKKLEAPLLQGTIDGFELEVRPTSKGRSISNDRDEHYDLFETTLKARPVSGTPLAEAENGEVASSQALEDLRSYASEVEYGDGALIARVEGTIRDGQSLQDGLDRLLLAAKELGAEPTIPTADEED